MKFSIIYQETGLGFYAPQELITNGDELGTKIKDLTNKGFKIIEILIKED